MHCLCIICVLLWVGVKIVNHLCIICVLLWVGVKSVHALLVICVLLLLVTVKSVHHLQNCVYCCGYV